VKKIVLDVQHMGKPHNPLDRGAVCGNLIEANLCLEYARIAYQVLTASGFEPFLVTSGYYGQRAAFANAIDADLYLACHLNSSEETPKTHYSLVEISEHAGEITRKFAEYLIESFTAKLPVEKGEVWEIKKGGRGWSCINRVKAPALLLEPVFINHPTTIQGLKTKAYQIADSITYTIKTFNGS
jgi:N-acetylmuramoyl-L-alanine amidase